jgi:hypothetical protein
MSQHLHNSLAINSTDFENQAQSQHHSRSNNKNYRTPASTPSFKQNVLANLSKNGYDDANQAANPIMNVI